MPHPIYHTTEKRHRACGASERRGRASGDGLATARMCAARKPRAQRAGQGFRAARLLRFSAKPKVWGKREKNGCRRAAAAGAPRKTGSPQLTSGAATARSRPRATATGAASTTTARTATTGPLRSTQATPTTRTTSTSTAATTTRTTTTTVTTGTPSAPSQHPPFPGTRETLAGPALAALALQKRGNLSASAAHASAQPPHAPHTGGSISKFCPFPFWQHYRAALFSHLCRLS